MKSGEPVRMSDGRKGLVMASGATWVLVGDERGSRGFRLYKSGRWGHRTLGSPTVWIVVDVASLHVVHLHDQDGRVLCGARAIHSASVFGDLADYRALNPDLRFCQACL